MMKVNALNNQRGVAAIMVGVALVMLLGFAALAVDLGFVWVTRNELQNAADAAALGATRQLGVIYEGLHYGELPTYVCDQAFLTNVAREIALKNAAAGKYITINDSDVTIGKWNAEKKILTPTLMGADAIRVGVRRDSTANGPIPTFFARIFGKDAMDVSATATAALTPESTIEEGGLPIPVGISKEWFKQWGEFCDQSIQFYPTGTLEGCAGWHTFEETPPNANTMGNILEQLKAGVYDSPRVIAGATDLEFTGGNVASRLPDLKALFDHCRGEDPNPAPSYCNDKDTDPKTWTTAVVIYDWEDQLSDPCANPNKPMTIVGFATVTIEQVLAPPDGQLIKGKVRCHMAEEGRGGGGDYGTIGTISGLVQ